MPTFSSSCPWCHAWNPIDAEPTFCRECGHMADRSRLECRCPRCLAPAHPRVTREAVEAALDYLKNRRREP